MFGGLHIEMTAWKAVGTWMDGSGWTAALTQAEVATSGKAVFIHSSCPSDVNKECQWCYSSFPIYPAMSSL